MIPTMLCEWKDYRRTMYPQGISGMQEQEMHQAFFAGALAGFTAINKLAELPAEQAMQELGKLTREVEAFIARVKGHE